MNIKDDLIKNILSNSFDGIYFVDNANRITFWNTASERITGYTSSQVIGTRCCDSVLVHVNAQGEKLCNTDACPLEMAKYFKKPRESQAYLMHSDGHRIPVQIRTLPVLDALGQKTGVVEIFRAKTREEQVNARITRLQKLALSDQLTGLANRRYVEINLQSKFDEMNRYGWSFGVIFFDIDDFKKFNDTYGHEVGDALLKIVSKTALHDLRPFDILGRWGGEEFVELIVNVAPEEMKKIAERLRVLVERSAISNKGDILHATISSGATIVKPDDTPATLIERADKLMYQSKEKGKNQITFG